MRHCDGLTWVVLDVVGWLRITKTCRIFGLRASAARDWTLSRVFCTWVFVSGPGAVKGVAWPAASLAALLYRVSQLGIFVSC